MAIIERKKLRVYDYVSDCYKLSTQAIVYMNAIHPLETHDSVHVDHWTGQVVEGEELDDGYNRRILPPINPRGLSYKGKGLNYGGALSAGKRVIIGTHVEILVQILIQGMMEM